MFKYSLIAIATCLALASCTQPIRMRNPATGEVATCGPYKAGIITGMYAMDMERRCTTDFERQGYVRAPD